MMALSSARNKYVLIVAGTILMVVLWFFLIYKSSWQKYQQISENYQEQEARLEQITKLTETLESFNDKEANYLKKLNEQNISFPNEVNSAEILFLLKQKADEVKVDLVKIEARQTQQSKAGKIQINYYTIAVKGNPELLKKYIEKIQDLPRKIVITSFKIEKEKLDAAGKPSVKYTGTINLRSFNYTAGALVEYQPQLVIP